MNAYITISISFLVMANTASAQYDELVPCATQRAMAERSLQKDNPGVRVLRSQVYAMMNQSCFQEHKSVAIANARKIEATEAARANPDEKFLARVKFDELTPCVDQQALAEHSLRKANPGKKIMRSQIYAMMNQSCFQEHKSVVVEQVRGSERDDISEVEVVVGGPAEPQTLEVSGELTE